MRTSRIQLYVAPQHSLAAHAGGVVGTPCVLACVTGPWWTPAPAGCPSDCTRMKYTRMALLQQCGASYSELHNGKSLRGTLQGRPPNPYTTQSPSLNLPAGIKDLEAAHKDNRQCTCTKPSLVHAAAGVLQRVNAAAARPSIRLAAECPASMSGMAVTNIPKSAKCHRDHTHAGCCKAGNDCSEA